MVSCNSPILQKVCIERVECGIGISARKLTSQEDVQNDGYLLASHSPFPLNLITYFEQSCTLRAVAVKWFDKHLE